MSSTNPPSPSTTVSTPATPEVGGPEAAGPGIIAHYPTLVRTTEKGWRVEVVGVAGRAVATHKRLASALDDVTETIADLDDRDPATFVLDVAYDLGNPLDVLIHDEREAGHLAETASAAWKGTRRELVAELLKLGNRADAARVLDVTPALLAQIAAGTD